MNEEKIPYIGVSYAELRDMEYSVLEGRINANMIPYFDGIEFMSSGELERLRDAVKETRKQKFRLAHDQTGDIERIRIQLALSKLAGLFRLADDRLKAVRR